jgi:hypothetical protein
MKIEVEFCNHCGRHWETRSCGPSNPAPIAMLKVVWSEQMGAPKLNSFHCCTHCQLDYYAEIERAIGVVSRRLEKEKQKRMAAFELRMKGWED